MWVRRVKRKGKIKFKKIIKKKKKKKRKGKTIGATKTQEARSCELTAADPLPSKFLFVWLFGR